VCSSDLDKDQLDKAREFLDKLAKTGAAAATAPEIAELKKRLEAKETIENQKTTIKKQEEKIEQQRAKLFDVALEKAQKIPSKDLEASAAFKEARELARLDSEKEKLRKLTEQGKKEQGHQTFRDKVQKAKTGVDRLADMVRKSPVDVAKAQGELAARRREVADLTRDVPKGNADLRGQVDDLEKRLQVVDETLR